MSRSPARFALGLLLAAAAVTPGCGLPGKALALVSPKPTPTAVPTPTPLPVPSLKMEFVSVREERRRGPAGPPSCEVDIELVGAKRSEVRSARVLVRVALDDLGTNLVPDAAAAAELAPVKGDDPEAPLVLPVPLKVAPRKATSLREVSGEIELYVPKGESAASVPDPRFLRRYHFALKDVPLP